MDAAARRWSLELAWFELRVGTAGSVLGLAWAVLEPLLYLGVYWFLLTVLHARRLGGGSHEEQVVMLLCGLITWLWIAHSVSASLGALSGNAGLIRQTNVRVGALPVVTVLVQGVDFLVGLVLVLVLAAVAEVLSWTLLLLVPAVLLLGVFLAAVASLLAPLAVMLRDLRSLVRVSTRVGLFVTPVLYLPGVLPNGAIAVAYANPAAYFVGLTRYAVTGNEQSLLIGPGADLAIAAGFALLALAAAQALRGRALRMCIDHV